MFFLLHFPVGAFSSTFCAPLFPSEALGFSAGDFRVLTVTAFAVFNPFLPFLHSVRIFALVFSLLRFFGLVGCFWLAWASVFATVCLSVVLRVFVAPLCFMWVGGFSLG